MLFHEIIPRLSPKDKLSLVASNKAYYESFFLAYPKFREEHFGHRYLIMKCLMIMYEFVTDGGLVKASWSFYYKSNVKKKCITLTLCKVSENQIICINNKPCHNWTRDHFLKWFKDNMLPKWDHLEFGMHCWYKPKRKRDAFSKISRNMLNLLSES